MIKNNKLPPDLDQALRIIASNEQIALKLPDINKLELAGFIAKNYFGGWKLSSKGRQYLKEYRNPV